MTRKYSFPPIADARTRLLILGSLPGDRSLAAARYYAHPQNQFWRLIGAAIGDDALADQDYGERLARLRAARVGLWDVVRAAHRPGSGDAAITDMEGNDLPALVATLPDLRAVAFNGATAYRHGARMLAGAPFALIALPSSSPLHSVGLAAKLPAWQALGAWLDLADRRDAG
jgi:hypoxanthine-DNA glycosylase